PGESSTATTKRGGCRQAKGRRRPGRTTGQSHQPGAGTRSQRPANPCDVIYAIPPTSRTSYERIGVCQAADYRSANLYTKAARYHADGVVVSAPPGRRYAYRLAGRPLGDGAVSS